MRRMMSNQEPKADKATVLIRVIACTVILALGVVGFNVLKSRKKPPSQTVQTERALKVEVQSVRFVDVPVLIEAHGQLRSIRMVEIAAEVSGSVVEVHPRLQTGEVIAAGELLFAIDDRDYRSEYESNKTRLAILERDKILTAKELTRVRTLFEKNNVGTRAGVEKAEQAANSSADRRAQVQQAMTRAQINLERCRIVAPFTCRITNKKIEKGQYVSPGKMVLSIADDSVLELEVPLNSRDAFQWLQFAEGVTGSEAWFGGLKPVQSSVSWTENAANSATAILDRVSLFDEKTRTVKVVLRIDGKQFSGRNSTMPLVSGMFCKALIPGGTMEQVVDLPSQAVSFKNTVYIIREKRLMTLPVTVARVQDGKSYISKGLEKGDLVVTTRLVDPLERSLVQVVSGAGNE